VSGYGLGLGFGYGKYLWTLAFAAGVMVACQANSPAPAGAGGEPGAVQAHPTGPVEVVLWHAYREGEKAALEKVVGTWNERHPETRIRLLNVPYDAFVDKVTIATPRGQGPDLFIFAHNMIGEWVDRGHLLEPISQRFPTEVLKRFIPATVKALVWKHSLYGLPLAFKSVALFYDPALVPEPPATAEELVAKAVAVTDRASGRYGFVYEAGLLYFNAAFIHGFGGTILDARGQPHVGEKPVADALAWVRGLVRGGVLPSGVSSAMVTSLFNDGKAAMVVSGPWFLTELSPEKRFRVGVLPAMPGGKRAQPFLGSEAVFMSSWSKNKDAAAKVMDWLTSDEAALVRLQVGRQTVANLAPYERDEVKNDAVIAVFRAQAESAVLTPSRPEMQIVWSTMDTAINRSVFGDADPAAALAEAQAKIEADIAKMAK
jgi:maltose-binding protein MalE